MPNHARPQSTQTEASRPRRNPQVDPIEAANAERERDGAGRPMRSSLSDTDQRGAGPRHDVIGSFDASHVELRGPRPSRDPGSYTDAEMALRNTVRAALEESGIDVSEVQVEVLGHEVVLLGEVGDGPSHRGVVNVAQSVRGVTRVDDQLRVLRPDRGPIET